QLHRLFRLLDRKPTHRAGRVENEDEFLRRDVVCAELLGGLQYQTEEAALFGAMGQDRILNRPTGDVVTQDEVFVGNRGTTLEFELRARGAWTLDVDRMCFCFETLDDHAGIECDFE